MMPNLQSTQKYDIDDDAIEFCKSCVNHKTRFTTEEGRGTGKMLSIECKYGTFADTEGTKVLLPTKGKVDPLNESQIRSCEHFTPRRLEITDVLYEITPEIKRLRATGMPEPSVKIQIGFLLGQLCGKYAEYNHLTEQLIQEIR